MAITPRESLVIFLAISSCKSLLLTHPPFALLKSNACGQFGQSYQEYDCPENEKHLECKVDVIWKLTLSHMQPGNMLLYQYARSII